MEGASYVSGLDGNPKVLYLNSDNDDDLWLNANYVNPDNTWNDNNEIVFRQPRNSLYFFPDFSGKFCFGRVFSFIFFKYFCICPSVYLLCLGNL